MRAIVSTPDTRGGQWRLDGTRMPVRSIRNWAHGGADLAEINRQYPGLDLTADELAACLAWGFPAIQEAPTIESDHSLICVCGEYVNDDDGQTWRCRACGRAWRVTVSVVIE